MTNLTPLERVGIVTSTFTGIIAVAISIISMQEARQTQQQADERQQAEQASQIVAAILPRDKSNGVQVLVQNFSSLPVYRVTVYVRER